eukprot:scaffold28993_cov34-Phaeocystis_antarctica.AAC.4
MTDIRQIIRLACNHGVTLVVHGVKVIGSSHNEAAPAAQKKTSTPARDESVQQSTMQSTMQQSTDPVACKPLSKKAQRDASRLQEYQDAARSHPVTMGAPHSPASPDVSPHCARRGLEHLM